MELWKLWKKAQGRVEFELSILDALHDEFALVFVPEAFPVSVISCIQINVVLQYVQTGCCEQNLFFLCPCSEW